MSRAFDILAPVVLIVLLLALWEAVCRGFGVPEIIVPPPSAIWTSLTETWPLLLHSAWETLSTALGALVIASLVATAFALLTSLHPLAEHAVRPIAVGLQVTPVVALAPLALIWAGIDHPGRAVVALAAIVAFFPIFSGALTGLASADPDLERLFDLYGAGRGQRLLRLRLPAALPYMLEGHKVAAGLAIVGTVVAEFAAGSGGIQGLAWRIMEASNRLQTARMFAALLVLTVLGYLVFQVFRAAEVLILARWRGR